MAAAGQSVGVDQECVDRGEQGALQAQRMIGERRHEAIRLHPGPRRMDGSDRISRSHPMLHEYGDRCGGAASDTSVAVDQELVAAAKTAAELKELAEMGVSRTLGFIGGVDVEELKDKVVAKLEGRFRPWVQQADAVRRPPTLHLYQRDVHWGRL